MHTWGNIQCVHTHKQVQIISLWQSEIWEAQGRTSLTIRISLNRLKQDDEREWAFIEKELDIPYAMPKGFESEPIKGLGSHQEKCLSSSVKVVSEVKTAVNANDAWNQPLWVPPASRKKTQAHEGEECKITTSPSLSSNRKEKENLTNQHIKCIPYLSPGSSVSARWPRGEPVLN